MSEQGPVRARLYVEFNGEVVEDVYEIDRAEWDAMTPKERLNELIDAAVTHQSNYAPSGFEVLGDDADGLSE